LVTFRADGSNDADISISGNRFEAGAYRFDLQTPRGKIENLELRHFGRHMVENVAAAAAFLLAAGEDIGLIRKAVDAFETEPLRGEIIKQDEQTFILDCYNAAPDAMMAGIDSLRDIERNSRLVLVLADMLELGEHSARAHDELLAAIEALKPDLVAGLGPEMNRIANALSRQGMTAAGFADRPSMIEGLRELLLPGDTIYFKGSHSFALEKVAEAVMHARRAQN
jgi:UDP-N-acetylmuramoyl-tripeptide--D-alanyl-D-alanine ligase